MFTWKQDKSIYICFNNTYKKNIKMTDLSSLNAHLFMYELVFLSGLKMLQKWDNKNRLIFT